MENSATNVKITYDTNEFCGKFMVDENMMDSPIWTRLKLTLRAMDIEFIVRGNELELSWSDTLDLIRRFGSRKIQYKLNFRFHPVGEAQEKIKEFSSQVLKIREQRTKPTENLSQEEIVKMLQERSFTERNLKDFQLRDLSRLLSLSNGANFSVPGSGKTTVTFALHILTQENYQNLLIISPKSAFQAWESIVNECIAENAPENRAEPFTYLNGTAEETEDKLNSNASRFIMSYDLALRQKHLLSKHFLNQRTHLVLDESHHIKAGWKSQRGSFLLSIADLPVRRDILTGTPMPQEPSDLGSQLDFLYPGQGLGLELLDKPPKEVLGNLYVRTTKEELGLPEVNTEFIDIDMDCGQLALYSIVRNEFLRENSNDKALKRATINIKKARRSVIRLLQLSVNPISAIGAITNAEINIDSGIVDQIYNEERSAKMRAVIDHVYDLSKSGKKSVVWTIFKDSIFSLENSLADLNPVTIYGDVRTASFDDFDSREGKLKRFHKDDNCMVLIANPATAGEGINLHKVCHNAIYLDRSYVSTHFLQSIDRIHRIGIKENQETNVFIYRSKAPPEIGSIDCSVNRRLKEKVQALEKLLNDKNLRKIALDEENSPEPFNYGIELKDIRNLIVELSGGSSG